MPGKGSLAVLALCACVLFSFRQALRDAPKEWQEALVLRVVPRRHVAGVAGLQLVVQALHQPILDSGGDCLLICTGPTPWKNGILKSI